MSLVAQLSVQLPDCTQDNIIFCAANAAVSVSVRSGHLCNHWRAHQERLALLRELGAQNQVATSVVRTLP
jgi:hypothetical protein